MRFGSWLATAKIARRSLIFNAGALHHPLVSLLNEGSENEKMLAAYALRMLAANSGRRKAQILRAGVLASVELLAEEESEKVRVMLCLLSVLPRLRIKPAQAQAREDEAKAKKAAKKKAPKVRKENRGLSLNIVMADSVMPLQRRTRLRHLSRSQL